VLAGKTKTERGEVKGTGNTEEKKNFSLKKRGQKMESPTLLRKSQKKGEE